MFSSPMPRAEDAGRQGRQKRDSFLRVAILPKQTFVAFCCKIRKLKGPRSGNLTIDKRAIVMVKLPCPVLYIAVDRQFPNFPCLVRFIWSSLSNSLSPASLSVCPHVLGRPVLPGSRPAAIQLQMLEEHLEARRGERPTLAAAAIGQPSGQDAQIH